MAKIAFILPSFVAGGAERVALNLANGFAQQGHDVDLVLLKKTGALLAEVPSTITVVDLKVERIRSAVIPLVKYFRSRKPESVQAFMWPVTIVAVIAKLLSRKNMSLIVSDHTTVSQQYAYFSKIKHRILAGSIRTFYPLADARVAVSEGAASDLRALGSLKSVTVIRNPVSGPDTMPAPPPEVIKLWKGRRRILAVGNQGPAKDYPTLLRAMALLPDKCGLVIVGRQGLGEELEELSNHLGIADRVCFAGFQPDVHPFYAAAECFVLSSVYEGSPLVLVEALRAGLPIVSTDCPSGPAEVLANGEYGKLVPPRDADRLASAIDDALEAGCDPIRQRDRGLEQSGNDSVAHYARAMRVSSH